jgi:hypothetical protein
MFDTIPSIYWMIIIGVLVAFLTFILYQLGMLIKDTREVLVETKETLKKTNEIIEDAQKIVSITKATVEEVNETIITPVRAIDGVLSNISAFIQGFKSN